MNAASPAACADLIRGRCRVQPTLGIVLGSGLGEAALEANFEATIPYADLPGFPQTGVAGHRGELFLGRLGGVPVATLSGRAHYYEGHDLATVTYPIRVLAAVGVRLVVLTNAAGGIRSDLVPGDIVALTDHLNFIGANPLRGETDPRRFVDLSEVYSPALRDLLHRAAADIGATLKEGVYAAVSGPSYETPAEIRALARLGADLVGMSTAPEAIVAKHCGMEIAALSCVTNRAAGLGGVIAHTEVLEIGRRVAPVVAQILARFAVFYDLEYRRRKVD